MPLCRLAEANAKTGVILKERIRINRRLNRKPPGLRILHVKQADWLRITRALKHCLDDPLALPPLGLGHMKLTELRDEVHTRGLPVIPNAIRMQMKRQIQEDADARTRTWLLAIDCGDECRSMVDEHGGRGLRESGGRVDAGVLGGNRRSW